MGNIRAVCCDLKRMPTNKRISSLESVGPLLTSVCENGTVNLHIRSNKEEVLEKDAKNALGIETKTKVFRKVVEHIQV